MAAANDYYRRTRQVLCAQLCEAEYCSRIAAGMSGAYATLGAYLLSQSPALMRGGSWDDAALPAASTMLIVSAASALMAQYYRVVREEARMELSDIVKKMA